MTLAAWRTQSSIASISWGRLRSRLAEHERIVLCSLFGYWASAALPLLTHAPGSWRWEALAALTGALAGTRSRSAGTTRPSILAWLLCTAAMTAGMVIDLRQLPPDAIASLCGSMAGRAALEAVEMHLRSFPASCIATVIALGLIRVNSIRRRRNSQGTNALAIEVVGVLAEAALMLTLMAWSTAVTTTLAALTNTPWTSDSVAALTMAGALAALLVKKHFAHHLAAVSDGNAAPSVD